MLDRNCGGLNCVGKKGCLLFLKKKLVTMDYVLSTMDVNLYALSSSDAEPPSLFATHQPFRLVSTLSSTYIYMYIRQIQDLFFWTNQCVYLVGQRWKLVCTNTLCTCRHSHSNPFQFYPCFTLPSLSLSLSLSFSLSLPVLKCRNIRRVLQQQHLHYGTYSHVQVYMHEDIYVRTRCTPITCAIGGVGFHPLG